MPAKILIIDDDAKFIQEARNVLEAKNYSVCSNLDIGEDIEIDFIDDPDLIILKIIMCGCEKCIKLLEKIEKKIKKKNVPIIAITDTKRDKYLSNEFLMDIDWRLVKNTLNKPVNTSDLVRCVNFTIAKQQDSMPVVKSFALRQSTQGM